MTTARINKAIAFLGMEIIRNDGWQYFLDVSTGEQVGESVWVCYLNSLTLDRWVEEARARWVAREAECLDVHPARVHAALDQFKTAEACRAYLDTLKNGPSGVVKPANVTHPNICPKCAAVHLLAECPVCAARLTEAREWLELVAVSFHNAKRNRSRRPDLFKRWAVDLSRAASTLAKIIQEKQ